MISALSRNVTHVRAEEFSDCRSYGAPEVLQRLVESSLNLPEVAAAVVAVVGGPVGGRC